MYADDFLQPKLNQRLQQQALRTLQLPAAAIDFCSNDYLGIATQNLLRPSPAAVGSGGSRLLAGHTAAATALEQKIASFHQSATALLFNSGYDANIGLLASIPQRGDTILYDYLCHASIRDGMRLSHANHHAFAHNNMSELKAKLQTARGNIFIVTESVFSMDGDKAPLAEMVILAQQYGAHLIIDEAHATGIVGPQGAGLVQELQLQNHIFARVHTFGKALGCHGAVVLGSERLQSYLINFARSLMYSTALPPIALNTIAAAYQLFPQMQAQRAALQNLISYFKKAVVPYPKLVSDTAIQGVIVPGNTAVKALAQQVQKAGFDIRAVLYPTVPEGSERLRIILHSFNTIEQLQHLELALQKI
jgi:8-amino-7-oxononanoate synthase